MNSKPSEPLPYFPTLNQGELFPPEQISDCFGTWPAGAVWLGEKMPSLQEQQQSGKDEFCDDYKLKNTRTESMT